MLVRKLHNNLDILLITETKIDSSFPTAQFQIEGYTTYRLDRNTNGGGILLYIREDIPSTLLNSDMSVESFSIEINIRKKNWLLVCTYNPNKNLISSHLKEIGKNLDNYSSKYDNFILLGDFNSEPTESAVRDFCEIYSCKNLIKDNTCFKNPSKPSCIDLIITNRPKSFQNSVTVETGLSDFHKMTLTVMKVFYKKQKPNIATYRNYKHFSNEAFMFDVKNSPLIWMFHSRRLNNKINSIHERALRITYDNASTFEELLNKDNSVSIHHRNLRVLATEMFKIHQGLSPEILRETFVPKTSSYNLRRNHTFKKRKVHSVYHGTESLSFLGPKIWDLVPVELKLSETLFSFKLRIRNWVPFECPCRICKTYLQQVGFL